MDALQIFQTGVTVASSASSATTALPTAQNGVTVKYVRIAASGELYVRLGAAGVVATAGDMLVQPADSMILATNGATHFAVIQGGASGTARVNVVPVENF
jgi:hypothetical protein